MSAFIPAHVSDFTARILRTVVIALVLFSCSIASAQRDVRVEESVRAAAPTAAQLEESNARSRPTDQVLCRAFPDYAGSAERRARLEAALARIPPSPARQTDSAPDGPALLRASVSNALATAVATNPAPFSIPDARATPPAPRVLPDEFVLPEIPQEWRQ